MRSPLIWEFPGDSCNASWKDFTLRWERVKETSTRRRPVNGVLIEVSKKRSETKSTSEHGAQHAL